MPQKSRYVLVVDNISSTTPLRDIEDEARMFGKVRDAVKDSKARCCLLEFEKSFDCTAAWKKLDGFRMDGRAWKVDYATVSDFKFFGWKWYEHSPSPPRRRSPSPVRGRSPSRSPGRKHYDEHSNSPAPRRRDSDDNGPTRGHSPARSRSRSPHGYDD